MGAAAHRETGASQAQQGARGGLLASRTGGNSVRGYSVLRIGYRYGSHLCPRRAHLPPAPLPSPLCSSAGPPTCRLDRRQQSCAAPTRNERQLPRAASPRCRAQPRPRAQPQPRAQPASGPRALDTSHETQARAYERQTHVYPCRRARCSARRTLRESASGRHGVLYIHVLRSTGYIDRYVFRSPSTLPRPVCVAARTKGTWKNILHILRTVRMG